MAQILLTKSPGVTLLFYSERDLWVRCSLSFIGGHSRFNWHDILW